MTGRDAFDEAIRRVLDPEPEPAPEPEPTPEPEPEPKSPPRPAPEPPARKPARRERPSYLDGNGQPRVPGRGDVGDSTDRWASRWRHRRHF